RIMRAALLDRLAHAARQHANDGEGDLGAGGEDLDEVVAADAEEGHVGEGLDGGRAGAGVEEGGGAGEGGRGARGGRAGAPCWASSRSPLRTRARPSTMKKSASPRSPSRRNGVPASTRISSVMSATAASSSPGTAAKRSMPFKSSTFSTVVIMRRRARRRAGR